jgi:hypothetical protein
MKNTIINLIAVVAVSFSGTAFAAEEIESKPQPAAAASAVPAATVVESAPAESAERLQPAAKRAKARTFRPKDMDLRHCLELDGNPAIARCARE